MQLIFIDRPYKEKMNTELSIHDYDGDIKSPLHKMSVTATNNNHLSESYVQSRVHSQKNNLLKILICLIIILLAVLVVFIILYINVKELGINNEDRTFSRFNSIPKNETVCRTGECVQVAARKS